MSLFKTARPLMTKTAATKLLGENPDGWANEILSQLFSQHSFIGQYKVDFQVQAQNDEMGYLYGYYLVTPLPPPADPVNNTYDQQQTAVPSAEEVETQARMNGTPSVRIPVIMSTRKLYPMDVMISTDGTFQPLTEPRFQQIMASPELFETARSPAAGGNMGEFMPPARMGSPNQTVVSKTSSILEDLAEVVPERKKQAFYDKLAAPELRWSLENREPFYNAVGKLYRVKTASTELAVQRTKSLMPADAVIVEKTAEGFLVKSASAAAFETETLFVPRENADLIPTRVLVDAQRSGYGIAVMRPREEREEMPEYEIAKIAGVYFTQSTDGSVYENSLVIPEVYQVNGRLTGATLALAPDSSFTMQEKVAGVYVPSDLDLTGQGDTLHGRGVFVSPDGSRASEVVTLMDSVSNSRGSYINATTVEGGTRLVKVANLMTPAQIDRQTHAIPADWEFVRVGNRVKLMDESHMAKLAYVGSQQNTEVQIISDGSRFSLRSQALEDLATQEREVLSYADAALLLGCMNVPEETIRTKLAEASRKRTASCRTRKCVTSRATKVAKTKKKLAAAFQLVTVQPLDLVKEAALLADESSVDAVLSLGFVSPDNATVFLDHIDDMEQAVRQLAELLVAARLGLPDVPDAAVEKSMQGLEKTLQGLKSLQIRLQNDDPQAQMEQLQQ